MAKDALSSFLRAEEEAHRLVEVLTQLKKEVESYSNARTALDQAGSGISELSTRCARIAEQLGNVAKTLHSIGTPELLQRLETIAGELLTLRQQLDQQHESLQHKTQDLQANLNTQLESTKALTKTVRNLALGSIGLSLITLAAIAWLILTLLQG